MRTRTVILLAASLALAACGGRGTVEPPPDPEAVVLQVTSEGGFVPVELLVNRPPRFTLTAGGELIFEGPSPAIYPGPLLTELRVAAVDSATMDRILGLVEAIGLPDFEAEANLEAADRVADATTEVVTFFDASGGEHRFAVYALGIVETSDRRVRRFQELVDLLDEVTSTAETRPYEGEALVVFVGPGDGAGELGAVRPWPLPDDVGSMVERPGGWRCRVYRGEERRRLLALFADADQATRWEADGRRYLIVARPVVPGEDPCGTADEG